MKARTSILFLLAITIALAALPSIRGIAAGWTLADAVTSTAGTASGNPTVAGNTVETTAFALG